MKRLTALVVACALLLCGAASAAQWGEGLGPSKPYSYSKEVNLDKSFGYIILYPREKLPADGFCNKLLMYFPREDVYAGEGKLTLYENVEGVKDPVEVCSVDMGDPRNVNIRPMTEDEMTTIIWGSGVCAEIHLPKSLEFADGPHSYFVFMDEGCLTAGKDHNIRSPRISRPEAWNPAISQTSTYGISGFRYVDCEPEATEEEALEALFAELAAAQDAADSEESGDAAAEPADADTSEDAETEEGAGEEAAPEEEAAASDEWDDLPPVDWPDTGDKIIFDLVMGGEAKVAVPFSDNGSVVFDRAEYSESCHVVGTVLKDDVSWGVLFLKDDEENPEENTLQMIMFGIPTVETPAEEEAEEPEAE